jgi:hypothetical protein
LLCSAELLGDRFVDSRDDCEALCTQSKHCAGYSWEDSSMHCLLTRDPGVCRETSAGGTATPRSPGSASRVPLRPDQRASASSSLTLVSEREQSVLHPLRRTAQRKRALL